MMNKALLVVVSVLLVSSNAYSGEIISSNKVSFQLPYDAVMLKDRRIKEVCDKVGEIAYKKNWTVTLICADKYRCEDMQNYIMMSANIARRSSSISQPLPRLQVLNGNAFELHAN